MIPFVAVVSLQNQQSRTFRLWIPIFLIWILLVPIGILITPFLFLGFLVCGVNAFRGVALIWQILWALCHTRLEVEHRSAGFSFHIL